MEQKKWTMLLLIFAISLCLGLVFGKNVLAADFTISPKTASTDNLIGASAEWKFSVTTTVELAAGDIIKFLLPTNIQGQPFSVSSTVTVTASSGMFAFYSNNTNAASGTVGSYTAQGGQPVIYGYVTTTVLVGSTTTITVSGITNAAADTASLSSLTWQLQAGTLATPSDPSSNLSSSKITSSTTAGLIRGGASLVSDWNSGITPSSYVAGATGVIYTFVIKASSTIPAAGRVVVNIPTNYNLNNISVNTTAAISNTTSTTIVSFSTSTDGSGMWNRVYLTTSATPTNPGDIITVKINNLTNPATAGVYRGFSIYTTKANGGLLDGSPYGNEGGDFTGPPPVDSVHIGGTNNLDVVVYKETSTSTVLLSGNELTQVQVMMGCPDKGFFIGTRWLNTSSTAHFANLLDCNYIIGTQPMNNGDQSFYKDFLVPGMKTVPAFGSANVTSSITFIVPDSTTTIAISNGVSGQNAFIEARSDTSMSFSPVFTDVDYATPGFNGGTNIGYAKIPTRSGQKWTFTVVGGEYGTGANFSSGGSKYWPPSIPATYIATTGTINLGTHPFVVANQTLTVTLLKAGTAVAVTNACVGVKRTGGGMFMGSQDTICIPNSGDNYQFKVPLGTVAIAVMRPGFGEPEEYPVGITGATNKTIYLSSATNYISVIVQDSSGSRINGAGVFANGSGGFGQDMTNASGTAQIYLPNGTYTVQGFAPALGPLTAQSVTINSNNPSVTFTVNTAALKTIQGRVTQGGSGLSGVQIGAHGTGNTTGGNGTQTDSNGYFTLYVPAGTYEVNAWSSDTGGLSPKTADVSSDNVTLSTWALSGGGTLRVIVNNASQIPQIFAGAFNSATGRGNMTDSWMTSGTNKYADIKLPAGTYQIHVGSPSVGEITPANSAADITAGGTTNVSYDAAGSVSFTKLYGHVTSGGSDVANATVWATIVGESGFFSTTTDSGGLYAFYAPQSKVYTVGVKFLGYTSAGDQTVTVGTAATSQDFSLTEASATITGTVVDGSGTEVANAWVSAKKTVAGNDFWQGVPTDAAGTYSLSVDPSTSWTLYAEAQCYSRSAGTNATAGESSKNITITAVSGCAKATPQMQGVTAASGGQVSQNDVTLDIPANAFGSSNSTVSVLIGTTTPKFATNATALPNSVQSMSAIMGTTTIDDLQGKASLTISYNPSDLPVGFDESKLQMSYYDETTGQWESVASSVNTTTNKIMASISHFTEYAPTIPGVPEKILGLTATAASDTQINLSWTADLTATYYTIYRSATDSGFTTSIATTTATTYSNTGLTASTLYYYEVAGINGNGEGWNSESANATTNAVSAPSGGVAIPVNTGGGGAISGNIPMVITTTTVSTTTVTTSTTQTVATTTVTVSESPATESATQAVKISLSTSNPNSSIIISNLVADSYQPGTNLQFTYKYANSGTALLKIRVVRELINLKGKVVKTVKARKSIIVGSDFKGQVDELLSKGLAAGVYTIRVKIYNASTNKLLDQNSFKITVEKLKKRVFTLGVAGQSDSLVFDKVALTKIKSGIVLPANFKVKYTYTNITDKDQNIRMIRELIDKNGKVVSKKTGKWTMKPGEVDSLTFTQPVAANLSVGSYTIRIKAADISTGEVLVENTLGFTVGLK